MTRTAIIVGAGIAGLATARALARSGWSVEVLDEAPEIRAAGAGIVLTHNGLAALDALELGDAVREVAPPVGHGGVFTDRGTRLQRPTEFASSEVAALDRATLHGILLQGALAEGVTFVHDAEVLRARGGHDGGPSVSVVIDGELEVRNADLLIGADGIDSIVRNAVQRRVRPDYSGLSCWRAVIPRLDSTPERPTAWYGRGEFGIVPIDGDRAYWFAATTAPLGRTATSIEAVLERFGDWVDPIREHITATEESALLRHDLRYLPTGLKTFAADGVVLVGDAAHAMVPTLGQGASMGIEDAVVLGELLADRSLDAALAAYDAERRPRTQAMQRASHRILALGAGATNRAAYVLRNAALTLTPTLVSEIAADWHLGWRRAR